MCRVQLHPQQLPPTSGHHAAPTLDCWKTNTTLSNQILSDLEPCQHICEDDSHGNGGATVAGGPSVSRGTTQELYCRYGWRPRGHRGIDISAWTNYPQQRPMAGFIERF